MSRRIGCSFAAQRGIEHSFAESNANLRHRTQIRREAEKVDVTFSSFFDRDIEAEAAFTHEKLKMGYQPGGSVSS